MLPLYLVAFAIRHQLIIEHKRLSRFLVVLVHFHFVFFLKKIPLCTLYANKLRVLRSSIQ
jgi:hypothetical protein